MCMVSRIFENRSTLVPEPGSRSSNKCDAKAYHDHGGGSTQRNAINHRKSPNREADESVLRQQTPLVPASITAEILLPREFRHHACTVAPFCNDVFAATPRGASLLQDSRDTLVMALPTKYSRGPQCTGATADRNTSIIVSPPGLYTNTDCAGLLTLDTQALLSFSV